MGLNQFISGTLLFHLMWNQFTACQFHNKHFFCELPTANGNPRCGAQHYLLLSSWVPLLRFDRLSLLPSFLFTAVEIFSACAYLEGK